MASEQAQHLTAEVERFVDLLGQVQLMLDDFKPDEHQPRLDRFLYAHRQQFLIESPLNSPF